MTEEWKIIRPQKLFVVFGFVMMGISVFLPWITASAPVLFGLSLSRTGLEIAQETSLFAIFFLVSGSMVAWFYDKFKRSGIICLAMSLWMWIEAFLAYAQLQDRVSLSTGTLIVWIGPGLYLLVIGVVITTFGSALLLRLSSKRKPDEELQVPPPDLSDTNG